MSETPDWLQQYAKQQGWEAPPQPDPKDIADLQAYADSFAPKPDTSDLEGTAAALAQPTPIIDPETGQPVQPPAPPDEEPLAQTYTEKNKNGKPKANVDLAFKIPGTDVDTDALKQGARAFWGAALPTSVSNPGPAIEGLKAAKKEGLVQGLASGDPTKTLDAINAGANASAQTPNEFGTKPFQNYGPVNPADIDPATGQPRKTAKDEEPDREPKASPGHWVNGQWVRTVSPEALGMEGKLERNRGEHAESEADAARALTMQREQIYNQRSAELQAQVDAARAEQARTRAAQDKADQDYQHAQQVAAESKIDTSKIFSDGGKAAAILGVALGAVGSAILKTPNEAKELVESHIEHELAAQKTNAANARDTANNAWARLRAATGSAQQADNMYRLAALQTYQAKLDEMNAGPQQRAAIDAALAQAKDTQQAKALQYRMMTEKYSPGYMVGGAPTGGAEADPEKVVQMGHESVGGYAPNTRLVFGKKEDASAVTDQMQAYGIVQKARDRIAALEKANPVDIYRPGSEAYEDAKQIRLQAVTQVGHLNGVKKLPIFDAENMNDALDTHMYNAITGASATHRMDTYLRNAKDALDESVQTRAPEVVRRHLDVNQRGEVTPGNHYTGENIQRTPTPKGFTVRDAGVGTREKAPLQYKPEIRHVTETPAKGKKKKSETVTSTEPEEDEDER